MKNYRREYPLFSLCGLNCGLCPIHHMPEGCPGCGGGEGHQSCGVIRCSQSHGNVEYCCQCIEYPCEKYQDTMRYDHFIPCRNVDRDFSRMLSGGPEAYRAMMDEKTCFLRRLLDGYNDGRKKTFFCTAVNLLELEDIRTVMDLLDREAAPQAPLKERAALAVKLFQDMADIRGISLKLIRKPRKKQ